MEAKLFSLQVHSHKVGPLHGSVEYVTLQSCADSQFPYNERVSLELRCDVRLRDCLQGI